LKAGPPGAQDLEEEWDRKSAAHLPQREVQVAHLRRMTVKMLVDGEEKRSTELMGKSAGMARIVHLVYQPAELDHAVCQQYPSPPHQRGLMLVSSRLADPQ